MEFITIGKYHVRRDTIDYILPKEITTDKERIGIVIIRYSPHEDLIAEFDTTEARDQEFERVKKDLL